MGKQGNPGFSSISSACRKYMVFLVASAAVVVCIRLQVVPSFDVHLALSERNAHLPPKLISRYPICHANPYRDALSTSMHNVSAKMIHWLDHLRPLLGSMSTGLKYGQHTHDRFFPFAEMAPCKRDHIECVGGECGSDLAKTVCGLQEHLEARQKEASSGHNSTKCVVYSIGGNNEWDFEMDMLKRTPCDIHTFDCTGERERFEVPEDPRIHFHHVCLTAYSQQGRHQPYGRMVGESWTLLEMQQKLGHSRIDLLKVDIEGWEWPLLNSWPELGHTPESEQILLPMQIAIEVRQNSRLVVVS